MMMMMIGVLTTDSYKGRDGLALKNLRSSSRFDLNTQHCKAVNFSLPRTSSEVTQSHWSRDEKVERT